MLMAEDTTSTTKPAPPSVPRPGGFGRPLGIALATLVLGAAGAAWWVRDRPASTSPTVGSSTGAAGAIRVEVATPAPHGLGRTVRQPGTALAFDKAALYAKVSGYLVRQAADIGDRVKQGDLLAEVDVPELFKAVDQAQAAVAQAQAKTQQAKAFVSSAEADQLSVAARLQQVEADLPKFTADRTYRQKEFARISDLARNQVVDRKLVDEQQQQVDATTAAERAAEAAIATAKADLAASRAKVEQARADVQAAVADVQAAEADLARARVMADYTRIVSPYDGVITLRSFHDGDFIRSAAEGGTVPVLAVDRTDLIRVVIMVPDLDVPYVDAGDPAEIRFDALRGRSFAGKVARFASSENAQKLMRTEVDLPNPDGLLRDGMYGTASLHLEPASKNLTIPSTCLIEQSSAGQGAVYLVVDGKVRRRPVVVVADDGGTAEIADGLKPDDRVIARYNGTIAEGLAVDAEPMGAMAPTSPDP